MNDGLIFPYYDIDGRGDAKAYYVRTDGCTLNGGRSYQLSS